jgi:hypothetical protein
MKKAIRTALLVLAAASSFSATASETLENCRVIKMIDDSVLEESLSIDEYPNVSIENEFGSYAMYIGANIFENDREFHVEPINVPQSAGSFGYQAAYIADGDAYIVSGRMKMVNGQPKKIGTVSFRSGSETKVLAEIACD